jgi:hypothetical protein
MNREFNVNGALVRFIDLENELPFRMVNIGRGLYSDFFNRILQVSKTEIVNPGDTEVNYIMNNLEGLLKLFDMDWIINVLSYITVLDKNKITIENYTKNIEIWNDANVGLISKSIPFIKEFIDFFTVLTTVGLSILPKNQTTEKPIQKTNMKTQKKTV